MTRSGLVVGSRLRAPWAQDFFRRTLPSSNMCSTNAHRPVHEALCSHAYNATDYILQQPCSEFWAHSLLMC